MKRAAPLKRRTPLKHGGPLPRESVKRRGERAERKRVVAVTHARSGGRCAARHLVPEVRCFGRLECDEIVSRARRPGGHLDETNTQSLCSAHNQWKENEPDRAKALGLARSWSPEGVVDAAKGAMAS